MNMQRFAMASVAVFVTFGLIYTGAQYLIADQFMAVMEGFGFEGPETIQNWVGRVLYTLVFVYIFVQGHEDKGIAEGVRYGLLIGLLMLGVNLDLYSFAGIAVGAAIPLWILDLSANIAAGAAAAAVYKPAEAAPTAVM